MFFSLLLILQLLCGLNVESSSKELPSVSALAYLQDNKVYVVSDRHLLRASCHLPKKKGGQIEEFMADSLAYNYFHFYVQGSLVWNSEVSFPGVLDHVPLADLKYFDLKYIRSNNEAVLQKILKEYDKKYPKAALDAGRVSPHTWRMRPLYDEFLRGVPFRQYEDKPPFIHSGAALPTSKTSLRVFLLQNDDKRLQVWDCRGKWQPDKGEWKVDCQRQKQEEFTSAFLEEFFIFAQKDDYYFLTQSGKLYIARAPEKGKRRQMEALWQDKSRPLTTFISDNDHKKAYCFGKSRDGKEEFFFALAPKIQPQPVPRREIQPVQVEQPRLRTVLEYVQVLPSRKEKEVRGVDLERSAAMTEIGLFTAIFVIAAERSQ